MIATEAKQIVIEDVWRGLYGESWKGLICDEAFAHPAKFSRALIRKIYDHVIEEGWAKCGDRVIDPFGGVALGAFDAMRHGLYWHGCELEEKFVGLGNGNIALWNERFSRMPNWGSAALMQGDSRRLTAVWAENVCCVTSPPYTNDTVNDRNGIDLDKVKKPGGRNSQSRTMSGYGEASGQLGNLAVTSPPYHGNEKHDSTWQERSERAGKTQGRGSFHASAADYGSTEGQLGAMPEGQLCVTSPPFSHPDTRDRSPVNGDAAIADFMNRAYTVDRQGQDERNLAGLPQGEFQAAISSPPYENAVSSERNGIDWDKARKQTRDGDHYVAEPMRYSPSANNVGNQSGETFWSASRLILQQLRQVIVPGGHAVFVVKAFVRDKQIVDFPAQWAQLCEAVGFRLLHHHRASLVEHSGTQRGFERDTEITVERKSFFRRLAEKKGSPRIDHESVLCFERP